MSDETLATIDTLLRSVLDETDDSDQSYKLRTALQLLEVYQDNTRRLRKAAEADANLRERLEELGYLR